MQWTPQANLLLFKHMLQIHKIAPDYKALAEAMGHDITPKALSHQISKIRALSDDSFDEVPAPTKVKKAKAPVATKGGKRNKKRAATEDVDEDALLAKEEESPNPAKKMKVDPVDG